MFFQSMPENKIKFYTLQNVDKSEVFQRLQPDTLEALKVVAHVLPFRVNNYVIENLIDWNNIPNDPIYQLTFMQKDMLSNEQFERVKKAMNNKHESASDLAMEIHKVRQELNPHPAGQLSSNVPTLDDEVVRGVQHKYNQTALVFPSPGQLCHSYCTFCFRWPQFVGDADLKFATDPDLTYLKYLEEHKEITDVLFTGGDPMVMNAKMLNRYLAPLMDEKFSHIQNIRIGSKSLSYWPYRYTTDRDAPEVLDLFKRLNDSGKQVAFMAHINHINEMQTEVFEEAVANIQKTGTIIRTQAPLLKHINDDAFMWSQMWKKQVRLGLIPYYMFIERDTGPKEYFSLPLHKALEIYRDALQNVSGLARTARGPSMSAFPGKVCVEGVDTIAGEKVFILSFLQARNPDFIKKPFFAKYDEKATWLDQLKPAFGKDQFFFE